MKRPYRIVHDTSTASSRELADWLAKDGQLLVPLELAERDLDELDVLDGVEFDAELAVGGGDAVAMHVGLAVGWRIAMGPGFSESGATRGGGVSARATDP